MDLEARYLQQRSFPTDIQARQAFTDILLVALEEGSFAPLVIANKYSDEALLRSLLAEYFKRGVDLDRIFQIAIRERLNFLTGLLIEQYGILPVVDEIQRNSDPNEFPYIAREYFEQLFLDDRRSRMVGLPEVYQQGLLDLVGYLIDSFETYGVDELVDRIDELTDLEIKIPNSDIDAVLRSITGFRFPYAETLSNSMIRDDIYRLLEDGISSQVIVQAVFGNRRTKTQLIDILQNKQVRDLVYRVLDAYSNNRFLSDVEALRL